MKKYQSLIILFLLTQLSFAEVSFTGMDGASLSGNLIIEEGNADSLLLEKYKNEVLRSYMSPEDSLMTTEDMLNSMGNFRIEKQDITYAPDSSFKIVTIVTEDCGAYCNSEWFSWIHFNLKGREQIRKGEFYGIDTIYQLPDNKYLIIGSHGHRPAGVLTVYCITPTLISFTQDSLLIHTIEYKHQRANSESASFSFCQENGVDIDNETFVRYDGSDKTLRYHYANNYGYSDELDIDTIRQGEFKYIDGSFVLQTETIKVNDNRSLPVQSIEWTEEYGQHDLGAVNVPIDSVNGFQLVYDCMGTTHQPCAKEITISARNSKNKKELLKLSTNGAYLEEVLLVKLNKKNFIYILTNETSGNSDGSFYYLNTKTMTAHEVEVEKQDQKLPEGCEYWGSYAYLVMNEEHTQIYTTSQFIDTKKENRKGSVLQYYTLQNTGPNQFILKMTKREVSYEE